MRPNRQSLKLDRGQVVLRGFKQSEEIVHGELHCGDEGSEGVEALDVQRVRFDPNE